MTDWHDDKATRAQRAERARAWLDGWHARRTGLPKDANPHWEGTTLNREWDEGWSHEDNKRKK